MRAMKTQLQKARRDYLNREEALDIEDACWDLIVLLSKLEIVGPDWVPDLYRYSKSTPAGNLVRNWTYLHREIKERD
jgi:hypothetical protein